LLQNAHTAAGRNKKLQNRGKKSSARKTEALESCRLQYRSAVTAADMETGGKNPANGTA
jgi:hypothetical protein